MAPDQALNAKMRATIDQDFNIVLTPISHPELGEIRIGDNLFAIGRTESPFESYEQGAMAELSRRHARIFSEYGTVYIADLESKNGTTVNGVSVQQKPSVLRHGDEISFGERLSYRVQMRPRANAPPRAANRLSLTLSPERSDLGLQPIVVNNLPFLISKSDEKFSRYRDEHPHQVNYLSRRHAHIFLKGGAPFVEDLGSVNGTFVAAKRLDEHAVPLKDGDLLAFGGHHFVYRVSLKSEPEIEPTLTKLSSAAASTAQDPGDVEKTTFVAAADSFLNIFCIDNAVRPDDEVNNEVPAQADDAKKDTEKRRERSRISIFLSELTGVLGGTERKILKRVSWGAASVAAALGLVVLVLYLKGAPEREVRNLLANSEYAQAAAAASKYVESHPDNMEVKTLGIEALLKANLPKWLSLLKAREFDNAAASLGVMKEVGASNDDAQPLLSELEWIGNLEKFVMGRGGVNAPIRMYADEEKIRILVKYWDEDVKGHQRALARISSYVPEFKDSYAEALSHLRKLQSDDAVYLAAIERLKATIDAELSGDHPENLKAAFKEYAEKYPRLAGLENLREDLQQYTELQGEARARRLGPLIAILAKINFSTPPFQEQFRKLSSSQLPSADTMQQYEAVAKAWREGDTKEALAGLQKMASGPWADVAGKQLEHTKAVAEQFKALQPARGTKGYEDRLLAFYGSLDPDDDVYFVRATEADVAVYKGKALSRAQELLNRAQALWRQYQQNGTIGGEQRLESGISSGFRAQARLLSEAQSGAIQGMQIYRLLQEDDVAQWAKLQDEIKAETDLQRRSLQELSMVLEPRLLKAKLALIGDQSGERRSAP